MRLLINPELAWAEPLSATLEVMTVTPSRKLMVPVGVPPKAPVTVAVKVVNWLKVVGFTELTSDVIVFALLTTCATGDELLVSKVVFALNATLMLWLPTESPDVVKVA